MICCFPVFSGDAERLSKLLAWILELGGCKNHCAAIVCDAGMPASGVFELRDLALKSFLDVRIVSTEESVAAYPNGPNDLFLTAAKFAKSNNKPWLFLEPDAVPLCSEWLDKLDEEYKSCGKPYMGKLVPCNHPQLPKIHMTGVGIYPASAYDLLSERVSSNMGCAFDMAIYEIVVPLCFSSELFQHLWGQDGDPPTFSSKRIPGTSTFGLDYLQQKAVVFHRTKDGTLIDLLRKKKLHQSPGPSSSSAGSETS